MSLNINKFFEANKKIIKFYSPYNFDRNISDETLIKHQVDAYQHEIETQCYSIIEVNNQPHLFLFKKLDWDTTYFNIPTYRLLNVFALNSKYLKLAIEKFTHTFLPKGSYCFMEIPSEDIDLIKALGENRFKLIETRLTYYNNQLQNHHFGRSPVREATKKDIPNLKQVATKMRNNFDRFHADEIFETHLADNFLATYIENSVLGFADSVLIPNEPDLPSDSFLTAKYFKNEWEALNYKISKMVLSAVSAETNKGWYIKLISEMTYHLRDEVGAECIFLNTQSTNRAVFNTWEKLNYKLGNTTHVFSFTK